MVALLGFLAGAFLGGRLGRRHTHRGRLLRTVALIELSLVALALLLSVWTDLLAVFTMFLGAGRRDRPDRTGRGGQRRAQPGLGALAGRHIVSLMTEKAAPCGSLSTEKRPCGMSIGGTTTEPPSSTHLATAASASSTAK